MTRKHSILGPRALGFALALVALALGATAFASTLGVENDNPNTGTYGAEVGVGTTCVSDTHLVLTNPPVAGDNVACSTIASDADVAANTRYTAGDRVKLRSGFTVDSGADFVVEIDRDLYPDAWVQDDTPDGETVYAARFYVDPILLVLEGSEEFYHFIGYDAAGNPEVRVGVKRNGSERRLYVEVLLDGGGVATTEGVTELVLPGDGNYHYVEVGWSAGTGSNNGSAYLCVDQPSPPTGCSSLSSLDNDLGAIDSVRWGAIDVPSNSSIGDLDLDDFESRSSIYIGPLAP